jgi:hypothetical protein
MVARTQANAKSTDVVVEAIVVENRRLFGAIDNVYE